MRIWFNHWFSSVTNIFDLIRQSNLEVEIISSQSKPNRLIQNSADEFYDEPDFGSNTDDYIDWCLKFCDEHKINIFIPRRNRELIAANANRFAVECKTFVIAMSYTHNIWLLGHKTLTYDALKNSGDPELVSLVPSFRTIYSDEEDFKTAVKEFSNEIGGTAVCMKRCADEGGVSFRTVQIDGIPSYMDLHTISLDYAHQLWLKDVGDGHAPHMLMPYLTDEVSCDCFMMRNINDTIVIPRYKVDAHTQCIKRIEKYDRICKELIQFFNIDAPCNIQFRKQGDVLKLLEINTRMSGGIQISCEATDINIPVLAIERLIGMPTSWDYNNDFKSGKDILVASKSMPIKVSVKDKPDGRRKLYNYIKEYFKFHGYAPSYIEIEEESGVNVKTYDADLEQLIKDGYLTADEERSNRALGLTSKILE